MAYYNKDGVKITHFEDDDEFAEFFNSPAMEDLVEEEEYDFYGNKEMSFWEQKAIDHFIEESWLREQDGK